MDRVGGVLVETYRLERLIAEGSMGSVYEARHLRIPKRFAVKFLRIGLEENAEATERFRREAEVVAGLDHPNIVEVYDYNFADDGSPYIVLEYLDGEHLGARLHREGKLPLDDSLRIIGAVAAALEVAHARNVIHRDLKPENVVLCADGTVKVVDFGVAKLRGAPELTAVNTIVGTVPYMAPEQLMGGLLDARCDEYALAVIAYEMLSGEMAFDGSGAVADVARRVLTHVPPFIGGVGQAVNEVLFRGMARAADDRFGSVRDFVDALELAAAVKEPSLPEPKLDDELPPLTGEATRITVAGDEATKAAAAAADAEDPPAPPPTDMAPAKDPVTPRIPSPEPVLGGETHEMAAVLDDGQSSGERAPLPSLSTLVVQKLSDAEMPTPKSQAQPYLPARTLDEPRVTLKTMKAATAPGWEGVAGDKTKSIRAPSRWLLLIAGVLVGVIAALIAVYALRR
ncbi:MAG TPA: serine/threonine-protein kinase [Polyangia bacterium]|nr:serine/threonine-protein kinase [Polyangia bacterium]